MCQASSEYHWWSYALQYCCFCPSYVVVDGMFCHEGIYGLPFCPIVFLQSVFLCSPILSTYILSQEAQGILYNTPLFFSRSKGFPGWTSICSIALWDLKRRLYGTICKCSVDSPWPIMNIREYNHGLWWIGTSVDIFHSARLTLWDTLSLQSLSHETLLLRLVNDGWVSGRW